MKRRILPSVVLTSMVFGVALGAGCSSEDQLDTVRSERQITTDLTRAYGVPFSRTRCPHKVVVKRGASFSCTAAVGGPGQLLEVLAVQRNDNGDLLVAAKAAVLHTDRVAVDISQRLTEQFQRSFLVDCGGATIKVIAPNTKFDCQAADGTSRRVVTATVHDPQGTLTYEVRDPASTAGNPPATVAGGPAPPTTAG